MHQELEGALRILCCILPERLGVSEVRAGSSPLGLVEQLARAQPRASSPPAHRALGAVETDRAKDAPKCGCSVELLPAGVRVQGALESARARPGRSSAPFSLLATSPSQSRPLLPIAPYCPAATGTPPATSCHLLLPDHSGQAGGVIEHRLWLLSSSSGIPRGIPRALTSVSNFPQSAVLARKQGADLAGGHRPPTRPANPARTAASAGIPS